MEEYSVIGKRIPRVDAKAKVTGEARYAADIELPGMLWCKVLRSPYAHARILHIDTNRAERLPGVKAVATGKDFGGFKWGFMPQTRDETPLAVDKVHYFAEAVAAVAAIDEDIAEEATELIKIDYEELPGVFDPEEAMKEEAPQVHDHVKKNISWEFHMDYGDVEKGFRESDLVREDRFETGRVTHGYLEPPAAVAYWDSSGITLWPAKQSPYFIYRHLAACFRLPLSKVRIIQPFIGGGFGGTKNDSLAGDFCVVLLSKMTGRPVKFVYTMEEELMTSRRRHNMVIHIKTGVKKDGTLVAIQTRCIADGGAYTAIGPLTMYLTGCQTTLPYKLPNFKHDAYRVFTNNPISAAMRGHGVTHTRFAAEIQMEMIAEELGMDPAEIRLKNAVSESHETINKITVNSCGFKEAIESLIVKPNWKERKERKKREGYLSRGIGLSGIGFLSGARQLGHQSCAAIVRICEDGTVNYLTGATDCGQGSDTILVQIIAEELGLSVEDIEIKRVDTGLTPVDAGSYGSRVTVLAGDAAKKAAQDARQQLAEAIAKEWEVNPKDIVFKNHQVFVKESPEKALSFDKVARVACYSGTGAVIIGKGYSSYGIGPMDFDRGMGNPGTSFSFIAQTAEVEVDMETGVTRCTDIGISDDSGRPLNPMLAEGQIEGGAIQGLGQAMYEGFVMDRGKTLNPNFRDYRMPFPLDVPKINITDIPTEEPDGPYGAKEASNGSITSTPPAVVSAIHDATGVWIKELPATPEKIWRTLKEKKKVKG
jgi:4-hydroxybenzoyl-CoA reductase subunit alpha